MVRQILQVDGHRVSDWTEVEDAHRQNGGLAGKCDEDSNEPVFPRRFRRHRQYCQTCVLNKGHDGHGLQGCKEHIKKYFKDKINRIYLCKRRSPVWRLDSQSNQADRRPQNHQKGH